PLGAATANARTASAPASASTASLTPVTSTVCACCPAAQADSRAVPASAAERRATWTTKLYLLRRSAASAISLATRSRALARCSGHGRQALVTRPRGAQRLGRGIVLRVTLVE